MTFFINEINDILGLVNWNNAKDKKLSFDNVSIDSRSISSDDLFVGIEGNNFDGHNFIKEVIEKGVRAVVIKENNQNLVPNNYPFWKVKDTKKAFQRLALLKRRKFDIPVIAITGSVGKTTTKEICKVVLNRFGKVIATDQNNNNEIGVGLTIHKCEENANVLILEMGMRGKGQIENLSKYSEPNIAVITNIGSSHIGLLGSRNNIANAKCEIVKYLNPKGLVIIPGNEPLLDLNLKKIWNGRIMKIEIKNIDQENKLNLTNKSLITGFYDNFNNRIIVENREFKTNLKGKHNALNFLYAYAISRELNIKFESYNKFIFNNIDGRNKIINTKRILIMDETYNASPESVKACLNVLTEYSGRHFLVLGSVKELGNYSLKYHKEIISFINNLEIEGCIFLFGMELEKKIKQTCIFKNKTLFMTNIFEIAQVINNWTREGDSLLIKGSRYWKLENLIPLIY